MAKKSTTSQATISSADRERKAIELRRSGCTFDEIVEQLGYSHRASAQKAVTRGLGRWMREADDDLRQIELERTDRIVYRLWPKVDRPDPDLKAIDTLLRVLDYRAKITGLYAPAEHRVDVDVRAKPSTEMLDALDGFQNAVNNAIERASKPEPATPDDQEDAS